MSPYLLWGHTQVLSVPIGKLLFMTSWLFSYDSIVLTKVSLNGGGNTISALVVFPTYPFPKSFPKDKSKTTKVKMKLF